MKGLTVYIIAVIFLPVVSSNNGSFGYNAKYKCRCKDSSHCDPTTGRCEPAGCQKGWSGPSCQRENVALHKHTNQSSLKDQRNSSLAVDGRISNGEDSHQCSHTKDKMSSASWTVDLNETFLIRLIDIYVRNSMYGRDRITGASVYTMNSDGEEILCKESLKLDTGGNLTVKCDSPRDARFLTIRQSGSDVYMNLCEVEVFVCSRDTFGDDCSNLCYCKEKDNCYRTNGECKSGCLPGWDGQACNKVCNTSFYGDKCSRKCEERNCAPGNQACDHVNGECIMGCVEDFQGIDCTEKKGSILSKNNTGSVVGTSIVVVIIITIIVSLIVGGLIFIRRQRKQLGMPLRKRSMILDARRSLGFADSIYVNQSVDLVCEDKDHTEHAEEEEDDDDDLEFKVNRTEEEESYYNSVTIQNQTAIRTENLEVFLRNAIAKDENLVDMFEKLPSGEQGSVQASQITENKQKNRYRGLYPYDSSRVELETLPGKMYSDYINASYIDGFESPKAYIAAQGPTKHTVNDFIRMIWEKKCEKVIMLTKTYEKKKNKCKRYWPTESVCSFGEFECTLEEERVRADFTLRKIKLRKTETAENVCHTFYHYHYMTWPDHGVPEKWPILEFLFTSRRRTTNSPVVVHCSAGIGRTGTLIALDVLLSQGTARGAVDIDKFIYQMRSQRKNMIQTPSQLKFLYEALVDGLKYGDTSMTCDDFTTGYNQHGFSLRMGQLQLSDQLKALKLEQRPREKRQIFYTSSRKRKIGHSVINTRDQQAIWKMMQLNGSQLLLQLSDKSQGECFVCPAEGDQGIFGPYVVECESTREVTPRMKVFTVSLSEDDKEASRKVEIITAEVTSGRDPSSLIDDVMMKLLDTVEKSDQNIAPITIVTSRFCYGAVFCLLRHILQRITLDCEVEVFNNIRSIQSICPKSFITKDLFTAVYNFAQKNACGTVEYANV